MFAPGSAGQTDETVYLAIYLLILYITISYSMRIWLPLEVPIK
jgi:hypothetical protein